jgi:hypothetical protein
MRTASEREPDGAVAAAHDDSVATEDLPLFFTPDEVARLYKLKLSTLASWRSLHRGPPWRKLGGAVRYPAREVLAWAEGSSSSSDTESKAEHAAA